KRPAAKACVALQKGRGHRLDGGGALLIPELPDVEVAGGAGNALVTKPPEENVACGLHQALPLDHPLSVVRERALRQVWLEDRGFSLFCLEEERIVPVAAEHQHDPRPGSDASDPDDLVCRVDVAEPLQQPPPISRKRATIVAEQVSDRLVHAFPVVNIDDLVDRDDERPVARDSRLSVDEASQPGERLETVL